MNWPEFESQLKQLTEVHETPLDTEAFWQRLRRKRRRRLLLLWFAGGSMLLVGALWYQQLQSPIAANAAQSTVNTPFNHPSKASGTSALLPGQSDKSISQPTVKAPKDHLSPQTAPTKNNYTGTSTGLLPDSGRGAPHAVLFPTQDAGARPHAGVPMPETPEGPSDAISAPVVVKSGEMPVHTPAIEWPAAAFMAQTPLEMLKHPLTAPQTPVADLGKPQNSARKTLKPRLMVGVAGACFAWRPIASPITDTLPYFLVRTKPLETVQGSLLLKIPLQRQWRLQTGLSYARSTERLNWEYSWDATLPRAQYRFFADGSVDSIAGSRLIGYHRRIEHYNHWTQVGIPVALQYTITNKKWQWAPHIGIQANWMLPAKGILIGLDAQPSGALFATQYSRRFLLQAQAGFEWSYQFNRHWLISLSPQTAFDLNPRTDKQASEQMRFWQYGVQVGVFRQW